MNAKAVSWSVILLVVACNTLPPATTPLPLVTSEPQPTTINTLVSDSPQSTGAITGVLIDEATGSPVTDLPLMPFGPKIGDLWGILTNYEKVYPDQEGVFTLGNLSPGIYKIYAILGETTSMGNKTPIMSFLKDSAGDEIEVEIVAGQTTNLGQVLVKK